VGWKRRLSRVRTIVAAIVALALASAAVVLGAGPATAAGGGVISGVVHFPAGTVAAMRIPSDLGTVSVIRVDMYGTDSPARWTNPDPVADTIDFIGVGEAGGKYEVQFGSEKFLSLYWNGTEENAWDSSGALRIDPGTTGIQFTAKPAGRISGKIAISMPESISGVNVRTRFQLLKDGLPYAGPQNISSQAAQGSKSEGIAFTFALPPGTYGFAFDGEQYENGDPGAWSAALDGLVVIAGQELDVGTLSAQRQSQIAGRLEFTQPRRGYVDLTSEVTIYRRDGDQWVVAVTEPFSPRYDVGDEIAFVEYGLPSGDYTIGTATHTYGWDSVIRYCTEFYGGAQDLDHAISFHVGEGVVLDWRPIDVPLCGDLSNMGGDPAFIHQAYQDFLGVEASPADQAWARQVISAAPGQDGRLLLVKRLAVSDQWLAKFITDQYQGSLRRAPDSDGLGWWTNVLRSGVSPVQAGASFFASDEYYQDTDYGGHGDNATWIKALYRDLLVGHTPDQSELDFYLGWIAQMQASGKNAITARLAVATGFYQSPEKLGLRVKGLYNDLLHRDPEDQSAYDFWDPVVRDYGDLRLAGDLAASAEYYDKAQTLH